MEGKTDMVGWKDATDVVFGFGCLLMGWAFGSLVPTNYPGAVGTIGFFLTALSAWVCYRIYKLQRAE
jgi:hypothetical protein